MEVVVVNNWDFYSGEKVIWRFSTRAYFRKLAFLTTFTCISFHKLTVNS